MSTTGVIIGTCFIAAAVILACRKLFRELMWGDWDKAPEPKPDRVDTKDAAGMQ